MIQFIIIPLLFLCFEFYTIQKLDIQTKLLFFSFETKRYISPKCLTELDAVDHNLHDRFSSTYKFLSCVLGIHPDEKLSDYIVVPNSLCPLGKSFIQELQSNSIPYIDIRGRYHIDIEAESAYYVLQNFNIKSFFITCAGNHNLSQYKSWNITTVSAVKEIEAIINVHTGNIFGPLFGKREKEIEYNWFYEIATNSNITKPEFNNYFMLSTDVAKELLKIAVSIRNNKSVSQDIQISTPLYSSEQLYSLVQKNYLSIKKELIPNWHLYKPLLLSAVMTTGTATKLRIRFQYFMDLLSHYLEDYPPMLFEIVIVYTNPESPFYSVFNISSNVRQYLRIILVASSQVEHIKSTLNNSFFPEYPIKNIGLKRARGEFLILINLDTFPEPHPFLDCILYNQFTYLSSFRMNRIRISLTNFDNLVELIDKFPPAPRQYLASKKRNLLTKSSGDFQGSHFSIINRIRGYIENDCVSHLDTVFQLDLYTQKPPLFMQVLGVVFHFDHNDQLHKSKPFYITQKIFRRFYKGFPSYTFISSRNNWGFPNMSFPELNPSTNNYLGN